MEGLSTGDFEPVFRELVGETAALSPNAIVRMKSKWESEYRAWCSRKLDECRYAYIWADGVYLGAGVDREKTALLCVVGAREDGVKELLGMELGYRESTESWSGVLRSLRDRGLSAPLLAVGDGALGLWAAPRCGVPDCGSSEVLEPPCADRALNVQSKLPKALNSEVRKRLREMSYAPTRVECERLRGRVRLRSESGWSLRCRRYGASGLGVVRELL